MGIIPFVLAVVAVVLFVVEAVRTRSLVAAGLAVATLAMIWQLCDTDPGTLVEW